MTIIIKTKCFTNNFKNVSQFYFCKSQMRDNHRSCISSRPSDCRFVVDFQSCLCFYFCSYYCLPRDGDLYFLTTENFAEMINMF